MSADRLKSIVARIVRLEEEKAQIAADLKEIYSEAKSEGYDGPALKLIVKETLEDERKKAKRQERDEIADTYRVALGMLADTPLGAAAEREAREADKFSGRANPPPAAHEDGAVKQADHDAVPAHAPASVLTAANDRKSSPAQTEESGIANADNEAPPMPVSSGREPYQPTSRIVPAPSHEDLAIPAFLQRTPAAEQKGAA